MLGHLLILLINIDSQMEVVLAKRRNQFLLFILIVMTELFLFSIPWFETGGNSTSR
jgi:hypothetical protein